MIACPSISSASFVTDTTKGTKKTLCYPDSVIRMATEMLIQGQEFCDELNKTKQDVHLLNSMLFYRDSLLYEDSMLIFDDRSIITAKSGEIDLANAQKKELQKKYSALKTNDRLKIGFFTTIVVGLVYIYIQKK